MKTTKSLWTLTALIGLTLASNVALANVNWSFTADTTSLNWGQSVAASHTFSGDSSGVTATVSGWSQSSYFSNALLTNETVRIWNGLGVYGSNDNQHTTDNNGNDEMILFSFSQAVTLNQVSVGYIDGDADITVLAYTGDGTPDSLDTNTYGSNSGSTGLLQNGWELIGNYYDLASPNNMTTSINSAAISSSYYLVGAYNWAVNNATNNNYNDYFKISALTGSITPPTSGGSGSVPEPSGILLILTGLIGWHLSNTKRNEVTPISAAIAA